MTSTQLSSKLENQRICSPPVARINVSFSWLQLTKRLPTSINLFDHHAEYERRLGIPLGPTGIKPRTPTTRIRTCVPEESKIVNTIGRCRSEWFSVARRIRVVERVSEIAHRCTRHVQDVVRWRTVKVECRIFQGEPPDNRQHQWPI